MSTSFRIKVDKLHVINLNPQKNLKCVLFQCLFYCKKIYFKIQAKVQNLKRDIINLKGLLYHTLTHQKDLVSPTAVLKLPKAYKNMPNYGRGFWFVFLSKSGSYLVLLEF